VQAQGWSGIRKTELLQRAEIEFDLIITSDQNIRYQQNLAGAKDRHSRTLDERPSSD